MLFNCLSAATLAVLVLVLSRFQKPCRLFAAIIVDLLFSPQKDLQGPPWTYPNGQLLEKFLDGVRMSRIWREFGPVYRIWSLFTPEIIITTSEDVKAFHADSCYHQKSPSSNAGWLFQQRLGEAMGLVNAKQWRNIRAKFDKHFAYTSISRQGPRIRDTAETFLNELLKSDGETTLCPGLDFKTYPFLCTAIIIYGTMTRKETQRLLKLSHVQARLFGNVLKGGVNCFPIARWIRRKEVGELQTFARSWHEFNEYMYETRRIYSDSPIIHIWEKSKCEKNGLQETLQTLDEMLFANLDVSAHVLTALVLFLAESPTSQERLYLEVKTKFDDVEAYCSGRDTFLHYCLWEAMRLRPISVFSMPEKSPNPKTFSGVRIPSHTWVVVDTLSINCNPMFWGQDRDTFDPTRFERMPKTNLRWNFFTYGFGPRQCLGKHLADHAIKMFLISLVKRYEWRLHDETLLRQEGCSAWAPLSDVKIDLIPRVQQAHRDGN